RPDRRRRIYPRKERVQTEGKPEADRVGAAGGWFPVPGRGTLAAWPFVARPSDLVDGGGRRPRPVDRRGLSRRLTFGRNDSVVACPRAEPPGGDGILISSGHSHDAGCGGPEDLQGPSSRQ